MARDGEISVHLGVKATGKGPYLEWYLKSASGEDDLTACVCVCFSLLKNTEEVLAYTLRQQGQDYVEVCLCTCELVCVQTSSVTGELRETMGKLDATI